MISNRLFGFLDYRLAVIYILWCVPLYPGLNKALDSKNSFDFGISMKLVDKFALLVSSLALATVLWAQELDQQRLDLWLDSYDVMMPFDSQVDEALIVENNIQTLDQYLELMASLGLYEDMEQAVTEAGWESLATFFQYSEQISEGIMAVVEEEMLADMPEEFREMVGDSQFSHVSDDRRELIRTNMDTIFDILENQRHYQEPE